MISPPRAAASDAHFLTGTWRDCHCPLLRKYVGDRGPTTVQWNIPNVVSVICLDHRPPLYCNHSFGVTSTLLLCFSFQRPEHSCTPSHSHFTQTSHGNLTLFKTHGYLTPSCARQKYMSHKAPLPSPPREDPHQEIYLYSYALISPPHLASINSLVNFLPILGLLLNNKVGGLQN